MAKPKVAKDKSRPKKEEKKPKKGAPKKEPTKKAQSTPKIDMARKLRRAAALLKQVADPTRIQVMMMLHEGGKHVSAICAAVSQSQPATSHHLALLRHGGLIAPTRNGKQNVYNLTDEGTALAAVVATVMG